MGIFGFLTAQMSREKGICGVIIKKITNVMIKYKKNKLKFHKDRDKEIMYSMIIKDSNGTVDFPVRHTVLN
jgi:hypothetical protein